MPYVKEENRAKFYHVLDLIDESFANQGITPGELNYLITKICLSYVENKGLNYTHLNDIMGVMESSKQEFYRRVVASFEQLKIEENGDI